MEEKIKRLYKLDKLGRVMEFSLYIELQNKGKDFFVVSEKGLIDGKKQIDRELAEPKNIGKANETTPEDQAIMMMDSKINKLKDKGYKEINIIVDYAKVIEKLKSLKGTDANGNYLPMLAQKDTSKITFPGFLQRKYDGMRSEIKIISGVPTIRSRNGKPITTVDHILDSVPWDIIPDGVELDGELYLHNSILGDIVSYVKRSQGNSRDIGFRLYDIIGTDWPYSKRLSLIKRICKRSGSHISYVHTFEVNNWDDITRLFNTFKKRGYEGAMWRNPNGIYLPGERSYDLIKIKDFLEDEFEIVGVEEATGRDSGTAIFVCTTKGGQHFRARPMGSREIRAEYLENSETLVGKSLTVRFQNYTKDGIPFHLRGIAIRDYE